MREKLIYNLAGKPGQESNAKHGSKNVPFTDIGPLVLPISTSLSIESIDSLLQIENNIFKGWTKDCDITQMVRAIVSSLHSACIGIMVLLKQTLPFSLLFRAVFCIK